MTQAARNPFDDPYTTHEAATTYRCLRLGIVGMVLLLAVSLVIEIVNAPGCVQTSISAYYYTPVRNIFVGALVAIGLCLIVIRGCSRWQDFFLNMAGMLAPIVALVPTGFSGRCPASNRKPALSPPRGDIGL